MNTRPPFRITGKWVLKAFILSFGVIFAVNGLLTYYALESWSGLETENAYDKGLAHNQTLANAQAQALLGWQVVVLYETVAADGPKRAGVLTVKVRDKQGQAMNGLAGTALLWRPTHEGSDQRAVLAATEAGVYRTEVNVPAAGQWDVRLELTGAGQPYRLRRRIVIK
jgi:nitrogen fixation protein FixH